MRNVGASWFVDIALKRAIDAGEIPGPRMITATNSFSIIGGHGDVNGFQPGILEDHLDYTEGLPTGPDECRKAVRYAHKHGAEVIKIMSSGGVMSAGSTALSERQFSDAELEAFVDEARLLGLKVCSHAHGSAGILAAVKADNVYRIIVREGAPTTAVRTVVGRDPAPEPSGSEVVTQVVPLQYLAAADAMALLRPFVAAAGAVDARGAGCCRTDQRIR